MGKMTETPGRDSRIDYLMLRMPKLSEQEDAEEEKQDVGGDDEGMNTALARALTSKSQVPRSNQFVTMNSARRTSQHLRMSVKVNLRNTESKLYLKTLTMITERKKAAEK